MPTAIVDSSVGKKTIDRKNGAVLNPEHKKAPSKRPKNTLSALVETA
jgi:hypothetical protein